jgi:hypothetical protein
MLLQLTTQGRLWNSASTAWKDPTLLASGQQCCQNQQLALPTAHSSSQNLTKWGLLCTISKTHTQCFEFLHCLPCRAFSTHYLEGSNTTAANPAVGPLNSTEQLAQSTYGFVVQNMQDATNGLWHWNVSRNGSIGIQRNKVISGQLFAVIGLRSVLSTCWPQVARSVVG